MNTRVQARGRSCVLNRMMWSSNEVILHEMWIVKAPDLKHSIIFGSEAFVHISKKFTQKFDSANYRLYDPVSRKVSVSRNVTFNEKIGKVTQKPHDDNDNEIELPAKEAARQEVEIPLHEKEQREEDDENEQENVEGNTRNNAVGAAEVRQPQEAQRVLRN